MINPSLQIKKLSPGKVKIIFLNTSTGKPQREDSTDCQGDVIPERSLHVSAQVGMTDVPADPLPRVPSL